MICCLWKFHTYQTRIEMQFRCSVPWFSSQHASCRQKSASFTAQWWETSFSRNIDPIKSKACHDKRQLSCQMQCLINPYCFDRFLHGRLRNSTLHHDEEGQVKFPLRFCLNYLHMCCSTVLKLDHNYCHFSKQNLNCFV